MRPPWLGSARCWQAPAVNSPGGDCGGIRGRGIGGQAEAEGDVGGELDAGGVAVVAGLAGEIAGGYGVAEQFGVASGQVEGFFVVVVAEPVGFTTDPALWDQAVRLGNQVIWLQTYGATFSSPERPQVDVRLPDGDPRQPLCTKPITSMPESIAYDPERCILAMGGGEFSPVLHEVMEYTVGGRNIFKSWFDYRKKEPGGKKLSQLDHKYPDKWDPDWTTEAIDLLTILTRLVELEPSQADMLERVLASELISMGELAALGTRWPVNKQDHKPRFGYNSLRPLDSSTSNELW